jgi:hypothetical protein
VEKLLPQLPEESALSSAFMAKNAFQKTQIFLGSRLNDYRSLNLNMMLKIELHIIKVAYGLMNDIKGYHTHLLSSSKHLLKKKLNGCIVSPVIVAGGLPI